jgi:hypothetical protein
MERRLGPEDPATKRFVEQMRRAAEAESDVARAREWRDKTPEEHNHALIGLLGLAHTIVAGRGRPVSKDPLPVVRVARPGERRRRFDGTP